MTAEIDYKNPACPVCSTSLTPLKERVKKRCHICGWEISPLKGKDENITERRDYMR